MLPVCAPRVALQCAGRTSAADEGEGQHPTHMPLPHPITLPAVVRRSATTQVLILHTILSHVPQSLPSKADLRNLARNVNPH